MSLLNDIEHLPLEELCHQFETNTKPPEASLSPLTHWDMIRNDAPILQYLFAASQPKRHLEYGTWQGFGTCLCLENSPATVWTINLPDGEARADGSWAYGERVIDESATPPGAVTENYGEDEDGPRTYHRTDAGVYIGRLYREKGLGSRVCQIYCDSTEWDTIAYPKAFFDSVLIDGGHTPALVVNDTEKALPLIRTGGLILWHDFCPVAEVIEGSNVVRDVTSAIEQLMPRLLEECSTLAWINPSHILMGIKK